MFMENVTIKIFFNMWSISLGEYQVKNECNVIKIHILGLLSWVRCYPKSESQSLNYQRPGDWINIQLV